MAPACFGCGGEFERALLEEVGDALFCRLCLGRLLRRVEERGGASIAIVAPVPASPLRAETPCFLCGGPLEEEPFVRLRGFAICAACSSSFAGEATESEGRDEPENDNEDDNEDEEDDDEVEAADQARDEHEGAGDQDARPVTPGAATAWCSRCGRAMPGPGSYRSIDSRPHCPACAPAHAALAQPPRPAPPDRSRPDPSRPDPAPSGRPCDACRRTTEAGGLRITHGFLLCEACLESEPDLALALAQARHRRRLERQGRRLLGGRGDD